MTNYITPAEAARLAGVNPQVIYRLLREGQIPAIRVGRQWRIPADFLERQWNIAEKAAKA